MYSQVTSYKISFSQGRIRDCRDTAGTLNAKKKQWKILRLAQTLYKHTFQVKNSDCLVNLEQVGQGLGSLRSHLRAWKSQKKYWWYSCLLCLLKPPLKYNFDGKKTVNTEMFGTQLKIETNLSNRKIKPLSDPQLQGGRGNMRQMLEEKNTCLSHREYVKNTTNAKQTNFKLTTNNP